MLAQPQYLKMSVEKYMMLDDGSEEGIKYEYIDGYAYMLAGGTLEHALIAANLITAIKSSMRGGSCRVYTSDAKVSLSEARYVYPDVVVSCDERDKKHEAKWLQSPRLVIEVLSNSTEAYDRGNKFAYYRECPTLQEYVLVNTQRQAIEVYRRTNGKLWTLYTFGPNEDVELSSIGVKVAVAAIYEDVGLAVDEE